MQTHHRQKGLALLMLVFFLGMVFIVFALRQSDVAKLKQAQKIKTQQSLLTAKEAILAYSQRRIVSTTCNMNCPRPGDLPCPDLSNNGEAATSCNSNTFGRLPWKTLGIDDVRDGANERLWYAVSNRYKNNTKVLPLNTTTSGAISLRDAQGNLQNDATVSTGLVAIIVAPGYPLTRGDTLVQNRSTANLLNPLHYLDIAFSEDNANFNGNTTDGFIVGGVMSGSDLIVNDVTMGITQSDINQTMQNRVLLEVRFAIDAISPDFPDPASMTDATCFGSGDIPAGNCNPDSSVTAGLIPVGGGGLDDIWQAINVSHILRGQVSHNWFQQNGWRELVKYNKTACAADINDSNCLGF